MSTTTEEMTAEILNTLSDIVDLKTIPIRFIKPFADSLITHELILKNLKILDEEIEYIVLFLSKFPQVRKINLQNNKITDKGVIVLMHNQSISDLNLSGNHISDSGLMSLAHHPTITSLNLWANPLLTETGPGVKTLYTLLQEKINNNLIMLQWAHESAQLQQLLTLNFEYQKFAPQKINAAFVKPAIDLINTGIVNFIYAYLGLTSHNKRRSPNPIASTNKRRQIPPYSGK